MLSADDFEELVSVCSDQELARAKRFVFAHDQRAYLAAHGLLRQALSAAQPQWAPTEWEFSARLYGRPELKSRCASNLRFNLSHCRSRVNCVVCPDLDCGIDVEFGARQTCLEGNDQYFLGPDERAWLARQPDGAREVGLMRFWTMKEALSKAVGLGLKLPFIELQFELEPVPRLAAGPATASGPWWLHQALTEDGHVESIALRTSATIQLVRQEWAAGQAWHQARQRGATLLVPAQPWLVW